MFFLRNPQILVLMALAGVMAYVFNYLILSIFPGINFYLFFLIVIVYLFLIVKLILYKRKKELEYNDGDYEEIPVWLGNGSILVIIFITFLLSYLYYNATLYYIVIDNGYSKKLEIVIDNDEKIVIEPKSTKEIETYKNKISLNYNGKTHNFNLLGKKYILNIDSLNQYKVITEIYSDRQSRVPTNYDNNQEQIISNELIVNDFDFIFEVPKEVLVEGINKEIKKRCLIRIKK